jgi:hypothetical protein
MRVDNVIAEIEATVSNGLHEAWTIRATRSRTLRDFEFNNAQVRATWTVPSISDCTRVLSHFYNKGMNGCAGPLSYWLNFNYVIIFSDHVLPNRQLNDRTSCVWINKVSEASAHIRDFPTSLICVGTDVTDEVATELRVAIESFGVPVIRTGIPHRPGFLGNPALVHVIRGTAARAEYDKYTTEMKEFDDMLLRESKKATLPYPFFVCLHRSLSASMEDRISWRRQHPTAITAEKITRLERIIRQPYNQWQIGFINNIEMLDSAFAESECWEIHSDDEGQDILNHFSRLGLARYTGSGAIPGGPVPTNNPSPIYAGLVNMGSARCCPAIADELRVSVAMWEKVILSGTSSEFQQISSILQFPLNHVAVEFWREGGRLQGTIYVLPEINGLSLDSVGSRYPISKQVAVSPGQVGMEIVSEDGENVVLKFGHFAKPELE